jgi:hypothetical protein
MNIPKHWAKEIRRVVRPSGRPFLAQVWRWSDISLDEARMRAREALQALVHKLATGQDLDRYGYGERPLREEVFQEITDHQDEPVAAITRNGYGALILNTAHVMFVDIDFPDEGGGGTGGLFGKLFGSKPVSREEETIRFLTQWSAARPGWGMRVYRTNAGLRGLVTHDLFDPTGDDAIASLRGLGSDPLYVTLCKQQASFRARLTPKPWRCGFPNPPSKFPWEDPTEQARYRQWEEAYGRAAARFTTCRLISSIGSDREHPQAAMVRELHDRYACVDDTFSLA